MNDNSIRVDFYLLPGENILNLRQFCCRLAEKAWKLGNRVWIRTGSDDDSRIIDDLLWSFDDRSFLPHAKQGDGNDTETPVFIGTQPPESDYELLINLAQNVAEQPSCQRIAEILNEDPQIKQQGRLRYANYDKNNYTLKHHNINL